MSAAKRYRITVWAKGADTSLGDYWVRHDQMEVTKREALLLDRAVRGIGLGVGGWCYNKMRAVNGRMVTVEELT